MTFKLYGFWRSIASFRVRVALQLKNLPFEEVSVDILSGDQFDAEYDSVNTAHVVPTLVHQGNSLFQSLAIMEYLDDIHPEPALFPKDPLARAHVRALALIAVADSHPLIVPRVRNHLAATFGADASACNAWGKHWALEGLGSYERMLSRQRPAPFAAGSSPTVADICIAGQIVMAGYFKADMAAFPIVAELGERCFALPAFAASLPARQPGAAPH
jgi:maleylpyruvate isomerase